MAYLFINRFFYPDHSATSQLLTELTGSVAASGEPVTVLTSRQRYDDPLIELPAAEKINGVDIVRLWSSRFGRMNLLGRTIDYLTFYLSAAAHLVRYARKGDVLVVKTDPPMLSVIAVPIAHMKGAKAINWLQDLFPEVAMSVGPGGAGLMRPLYWVMALLRNWSLRSAAMNVVLGDLMAARVRALGVPAERIQVISNWADGDLLRPIPPMDNPLRREWGLNDKFVVGYSGNLGRAHDYRTLLDAIAKLEQREVGSQLPIVWLFIGGGALYQALEREVRARGLNSALFRPYQPRDKLSESLSAADVHLVSLRPDLEGLIVPSKFHGITAVGRPTIFIGDLQGEIAQLVASHACGVSIAQDDAEGLAHAVLDLANNPDRRMHMGMNARRAFEAAFEKSIAVGQWQKLLQQVSAGS